MGHEFLDLFRPEELHPDLAQYLRHSGMWPMLQHPLVYAVPYAPAFNRQANLAYLAKLEALAVCLDTKDYAKVIWLHERPYRVTALSRIAPLLPDSDYWDQVGQVWVDSENALECWGDWKRLLASPRRGRQQMMSEAEQSQLANMPEQITVWRGEPKNTRIRDFSWSLSKKTATWFARRGGQIGVVLQGTVANRTCWPT